MAIDLNTYRWNCQACGAYGVIQMTPLVESEAVFDGLLWAKRAAQFLSAREHRGSMKWSCFDARLPQPVLDEMTQFVFDDWTSCVRAMRQASDLAHHKGWRP